MKGFFFNLSGFEIIVQDEHELGQQYNIPGNLLRSLQMYLPLLRLLIFFFWGQLRE